ncbi:hypothetical protein K502DRAFT_223003 [Neoconidiobolus thromboides FSU 785]|nr:hypothetical protein K502DRAFT_223003 [Neoconidiobolus thromboides FSU 785]
MEDISTIFTINENEYEDYCNQFMDKYTESNKICLKVIYYLREINNEYPTSLILHDINNRMIEKLSLVCNNYEEFKSLLNLLMEIKDNDILSFCFNKNIHNLKTMQLIQKFYSITTQQEDLEFNRKLAIPYVISKP